MVDLDVGWRIESIRQGRLNPNRFAEFRLRMDAFELAERCQSEDGCPLGEAVYCPFLNRNCSDVDAYDWASLIRTTLDRNRKAGGKPYFLPENLAVKIKSALASAQNGERDALANVCTQLRDFLSNIEIYGR